MPPKAPKPRPLSLKPDLDEAARRWEAYYAGEIVDRPVVCVTAPRPGAEHVPGTNYRERVTLDPEELVSRALRSAEGTYFGGEAVPSFSMSFGPDEIAVFCGGELAWSDDSGNTNWSKPIVDDDDGWDAALPIAIDEANPLWRRMVSIYELAAERVAGRMAMAPLDLHSNMDLVAALRGPERLCMDLIDRPETIDRAMESARAVFPVLWERLRAAGRWDELGYANPIYSMEGAAVLQCDFSCMISPEMFRRWVLPALEEEAEIARHVFYHWDGPGAVVHTEDLCASRGLHTLGYVPGDGHGGHIDHLDLLKRVQSLGKAVQFAGSPDEVKRAHAELAPEKVMYSTWAASPGEADALLEWFVKNT